LTINFSVQLLFFSV